MNPEILAQLKDIHVADPVSWWPLAWGWWCLMGLFLVLICSSIYLFIKYRRIRLAKRQCLNMLTDLNEANANWPIQLHQLLKRVCISYFPIETSAQLHGRDWIAFLLEQVNAKDKSTFELAFTQLEGAQYVPTGEKLDFDSLRSTTQLWVKKSCPPKGFRNTKEVNHV